MNAYYKMQKGAIYYVAIATVICSPVKITCYFHLWRCHVFARKLPLVLHWCLYNKAQFIAKCDRQLLHIASHGLLKITTGTVNRLKELCHEIYQNSNSENCHQSEA